MKLQNTELTKLYQLLESGDEKNIQVALTLLRDADDLTWASKTLRQKVLTIYENNFKSYYYKHKIYSTDFDRFFVKNFSKRTLSELGVQYCLEKYQTSTTLKKVHLAGFRYIKTLAPLLELPGIEQLQNIEFNLGSVPDLNLLQDLPHLQHVVFGRNGRPKKFEHLESLPHLISLLVTSSHQKLANIQLPTLKELNILTAAISAKNQGFEFLNSCKDQLEKLSLGHVHYYNLIDDSLILPEMPRLKDLFLVSRLAFSPVIFQNLPALEKLKIYGTAKYNFSPEGLERLSCLKDLQIGGMKVKFDLMELVDRLPGLERLCIHSDHYLVENNQLKPI